MDTGALLSQDGNYRYSLWRRWDYDADPVLFVMLNPSTADAQVDDPTIRRCIRFARDWGYGGVRVVNLYAWRATQPKALNGVADPVGPNNDSSLLTAASDAGKIVAAWGAWPGPISTRPSRVQHLLKGRTVDALALTKDGSPRHPLYVKADIEPVVYWD